MKKPLLFVLAAALSLAAAAAASFRVAAEEPHHHGSEVPPHGRWNRETVDLFALLPVQDGGRVKPLHSFAGFTLLALNGMRSVKTPAGDKIEPTEWLMDCLFFPEQAVDYDCFVVQTDEVIDAAGLAHEGKKRRDRYSYRFLGAARPKIFELASRYQEIDAKERTPVQGQLVNLAHNMMQFEAVAGFLSFLGGAPEASISPAIEKVFGKDAHPTLADLVDHAAELRPMLGAGDDPHGGMGAGMGDAALAGYVEEVVASSRGMSIFPPTAAGADQADHAGHAHAKGGDDHAEWLSPSELAMRTLFRGERMPEQAAALRDLEAMYAVRGDAMAFHDKAVSYRDRVVDLAEARGEYSKVPLEVTFYKAQFFFYAQIVFVFAFLFAAVSWIKPTKALPRLTTGAVVVANLLLIAGITMRCIIRSRPPVSTLYETILFITAVAVIVSMVTEYINRQGIALTLATVLGSAGMFLADRYEMQERIDTMPSLVAVLDTNFWLATHVTTVTIGYSAGLLAGAIGHVYVLGKVFGLKKGDTAFYKTLTSMTYGTLCFGLLFSVVGTVLGGIWANDSWGRFWGWDPKENGALAIVLWELIVLHARMGGFIRDFGVAMASIFGAAVVAASWWGVNLLGVGLHSYGFTSGILMTLLGYFVFEGLILGAGGIYHLVSARAIPTAGEPPPLPRT